MRSRRRGRDRGEIQKSATASSSGSRIGQGREAAKTFLAANPDIAGTIEQAIRASAGQIGQALAHGDAEKAEAEED